MTENNWYAISLVNGATRPAKDYWVELGPRRKNPGRYIKHTISNELNVARAIRHLGLEIYIPTVLEIRKHSRKRRPIFNYTPMIPGFGFIRGIHDFQVLEDVRFIGGILGQHGVPEAVPELEMFSLMTEEEKQHRDEQERYGLDRLKRVNNYLDKRKSRAVPRAKLAQIYPVGIQIAIKDGPYSGQKAIVEAVTGRQSVKAMMDLLGSLVPVEIPVAQVEKISYISN